MWGGTQAGSVRNASDRARSTSRGKEGSLGTKLEAVPPAKVEVELSKLSVAVVAAPGAGRDDNDAAGPPSASFIARSFTASVAFTSSVMIHSNDAKDSMKPLVDDRGSKRASGSPPSEPSDRHLGQMPPSA